MAPSTDTHLAMDACPPLEDIAAFLDGSLPAEERERIIGHLARCERCYEIFAGAVHFQESSAEDTQGRGVLRFPLASKARTDSSKNSDMETPAAHHVAELPEEEEQQGRDVQSPKRASRWLALAASILLVAPLGFLTWRSFFAPPKITVAGLVDTLDGQAKIAEKLYAGKRLRGPEDPDLLWDRPIFMAGVHLMDLRLSLHSGGFENTRDLLQSLGIELQAVPLTVDLGKIYEQEYLTLSPNSDLAQLEPRLLKEEADLQERLSNYPLFSFGLWTETGRLAAEVESPEFFATRKNRRFLSHLQKTLPDQLDSELQQPVLDDLKAIERTWDKEELNYPTLATHFQKIIKQIDEYE